MPPKKPIRVRIAPSPTGYLHIGTARTALFNWLFAKSQGGSFILRIEDTDLERSNIAFEKDIIENLRWLGLTWDEGPALEKSEYIGDYGPYHQTKRLASYEKYIKKLLDENLAYYCFCAKEQLEEERQAMLSQGMAPKYSGRCRSLTSEQVQSMITAGDNYVIRFKMPSAQITFKDMIRGSVSFDADLMGDLVIAKNIQTPLYNFAVVIDDYEMNISHVIRGEDHLANTPKQIVIQKALGFNEPQYAHLPLILDKERGKMSKRFAATSIKEYRDQGYLPKTLINFMAFLGWHPQDDREILSNEELIKEFDIKRVQKAGAIFNLEKLDWLNAQYIKTLPDAELLPLLLPFKPQLKDLPERTALKIIATAKDRLKKLSDFKSLTDFFFTMPNYNASLLLWKNTAKDKTIKNLKTILQLLPDALEIKQFAEKEGRGEVLWPLRVALSGKDISPGPFEIMEALEENETKNRINIAIKKLRGDNGL
ncbi:MAG: glutamate--tRNA ligase [bacterium]|nr:glutamate--tRNA ligase [bacterium]